MALCGIMFVDDKKEGYMAAKKDSIEITFSQEKDTKNAIRYQEDVAEDEAKIGTLYVRKASLPTPPPTVISVTVSW